MAVKPETRIVKRIIERLRQWPNAFVVKLTTGGYQVSGLPDVLAVLSGRVALIEVKTPEAARKPDRGATKLQLATMRRIAAAEAITGVVTSVEETEQLLANHGLVFPENRAAADAAKEW